MSSTLERTSLRAGPLTAVMEGAGLRWITWDGVEILRGVYAAVRDQAWGTIEPEVRDVRFDEQRDGFALTFTADHENGDVGFEWRGRIEGDPDGTLTFSFDGRARRTFLKNRIGFCVLHPVDIGGHRLTVETSGDTAEGTFPERIAARDPFTNIVGLGWEVAPGLEASLRFDGDVFEMEDQRNWTDASYKTFCTPLHLPHPVEIEAGTRVQQVVRLSIRGRRRRGHASQEPTVRVSAKPMGRLPSIGFATPPEGRVIDESTVKPLAALEPDHLRVAIAHGRPRWVERVARSAEEAKRIGAAFEIEATVADDGGGVEELAATVLAQDVQVARWLIFSQGSFATTEPVVDALRRALDDPVKGMVGGGSRANFAEFNRASLPIAKLDFAGYPINPQVHAFDQASIVETLEAQAMTVRDATAIGGGIPLVIGPVTLKPRFNSAVGPGHDLEMDGLETRTDPRQATLFAAAWALGSIASLAKPGVASLTFFETTGPAGLMLEPGAVVGSSPADPGVRLFPLYHVFAAFRMGGPVELVRSEAPRTTAVIGLRSGDHLRVLVASLRDESQRIGIQLPTGARRAEVRVIDEAFVDTATTDADALDRSRPQSLDPGQSLELAPWAIARIDTTLAGSA